MSVPMRNWLTDEYVTSALRQAGCTKEEVEALPSLSKDLVSSNAGISDDRDIAKQRRF
jgi:hypothetical protein